MNNLVDSIYAANDTKGEKVDPLVDSLIERAISLNRLEDESPYSIYQLHLRKGKIWLGNRNIEETKNNLYWLTEYPERLLDATIITFWKKLKQKLSELDRNTFQISAHLFWDREKGEILTDKQISDRFKVYDNDEKVSKTDKG